ncbi:hypothetical protein F7725_020554 [Dissostichus mawsoni]|uniref:Ig-like domain-containing protein n=1 Tax=Dissostichus mawsoni TaxID=36200 RepID=A0A7J5YDI1_DISMA|nr:hypothetical protein F7725_020554 [Dissostichus mawsoni]
MGRSGLLFLGFVLNVAHCSDILGPGEESIIEITHNITAVLGEDVHLRCIYLGESQIQSAEWKRRTNSKIKFKRLAGFADGKPFSRDNVSIPVSLTNLTVHMQVSSVEVEGEYICEFRSEEEYDFDKTINGSHYQAVSCSAFSGRPVPQISWLVDSRPPSYYPFTVDVSETLHSNGTSTLSSILRFPTHLQDEDSVTCVVQHPTLPKPTLTTVRVETFTSPNVTIKAEMVQNGGNLQREEHSDSDTKTSSVLLPAAVYEGVNVTCVFDHPTFTDKVSRVLTLPSFYLSGVQLLFSEMRNNSDDSQGTESLELKDGQSDTVIRLQVTGNVPHYNVTARNDGPLPEGVELVGSSLTVQGPVEHWHAGLYECSFSYHHLKATLKFNVTVKPQVIQPVPPTIRVDLRTEDGHRVIECSAADAVPVANMSWLLPEGVSGVSWFNFTSHNGSHSVRGVLLLPACSPWELTAECVINHPAFEEPENRSITLPLCARPNITINSSTERRDGVEYTEVDCSVESVAPAATITWHVGNSDNSISYLSETQVQADGLVSARSSARFLSSLYSGQNLTCTVEHLSLEAPETKTIHILGPKAPLMSVSVVRQRDSPLWLAVCDCTGEGVGTNLEWVLPENAKGLTSLHSEYTEARLTYLFPLALHEGQELTCVYQSEHGATETKTLPIPRYYISAVTVLNHTTPLQSRYGDGPFAHRLALHEDHHNQRILLRVEGNVPDYNLNCKRIDGSFVQMDGVAMVFPSELTEQDEGLYSCQASFYHHTATVNIQVEVTNEEKHLEITAIICMSSAMAILLILAVTLWVCCKGYSKTQYKKKESLSALTSMMQEPGSPEVKKPAVTENDSKEYDQLVNFSIVIDLKSTV